jgi:hypothetical protein
MSAVQERPLPAVQSRPDEVRELSRLGCDELGRLTCATWLSTPPEPEPARDDGVGEGAR